MSKPAKINLYEDSGYLNIPAILSYPTVYNFIVGGRGVGKTYGALRYIVSEKTPCLYLRRTQKQTDMINKADFSPFRPVCRDLKIEYEQDIVVTGSARITTGDHLIGYTAALSTFSNLRSFDMSDVKIIIYDEFIPELSERSTIKHEYEAFLNMYETVNRNRELQGGEPVKVLALANANRLDNKIFLGLELIGISDRMFRQNKEQYHDLDRSLSLYYPNNSGIAKKKADTALYRLAGSGEFSDMAINNSFAIDDTDIKRCPIKEYKPIVNLGEICIYRHKAAPQRYYVTTVTAKGSAPVYEASERGIGQFRDRFGKIILAYLFGDSFIYDSVLSKTLLKVYLT